MTIGRSLRLLKAQNPADGHSFFSTPKRLTDNYYHKLWHHFETCPRPKIRFCPRHSLKLTSFFINQHFHRFAGQSGILESAHQGETGALEHFD